MSAENPPLQSRPIRCLHCGGALSPDLSLNPAEEFRPCPYCLRLHRVIPFPALLRPAERGLPGEQIQAGSEAACFYHPGKRAIVVCEQCGRFLCALCDLPVKGRHLCPVCLDAGKDKDDDSAFLRSRVRYDNITLGLTVLPLLMFPAVVITAPVALFLVIRYWNTRCSLVESSRLRFSTAAFIACLEILGIAMFIAAAKG